MIEMELNEAQLFRLLITLFGEDRVVFRMSVAAACGGEVPSNLELLRPDVEKWARKERCLFTIVDEDDRPRLVVEFFSSSDEVIDLADIEHQRCVPTILQAAGVRYVVLSRSEFSDILDPESDLDLCTLLRAKVDQTDALV